MRNLYVWLFLFLVRYFIYKSFSYKNKLLKYDILYTTIDLYEIRNLLKIKIFEILEKLLISQFHHVEHYLLLISHTKADCSRNYSEINARLRSDPLDQREWEFWLEMTRGAWKWCVFCVCVCTCVWRPFRFYDALVYLVNPWFPPLYIHYEPLKPHNSPVCNQPKLGANS